MLSGTATDRLAEYFTLKTPVWHSYRLRCKLIGNSSVSKVSLPSDRALVPDYTPMDGGPVKGQEFSSVQDGIKALGKPMICAPARLSEVSPTLPFKQFQCLSDWLWPFSSFQGLDRRELHLSTPLFSRRSIVWCPYLWIRKLTYLRVKQTISLTRLNFTAISRYGLHHRGLHLCPTSPFSPCLSCASLHLKQEQPKLHSAREGNNW